ncbi:uncharacterized protein ARMOST_10378 [Armillaria ostoyae]|uniref:Uncharacterized protein n=1 Tax=Armillaria ostoyae TaxID=47428 RepID=A0A284RE88_ARMOS|nr:uncharacterized protein ARMOST_10378 [Armillaria ostoyae]
MSNLDHSWNEWAHNQPTPQPRGERPITGTPQMNFPCETQPQGQAMFQEPPLPPTQLRRLRTTAGTYRLTTILPPLSPYAPRTPSTPTLSMPRPRYGHSYLSRPFTLPATPAQYGLAPPPRTLPLLSYFTPPAPLESPPLPTSPPTHARIATQTPPITEEMNPSPSERTTTPSTHTEGIISGQNLAPSTELSSAPIIPRPGSSNGLTSSNDTHSSPQTNESRWATTSPSPTSRPFHDVEETQPSRQEYLPIATELNEPPPPETQWRALAPEQKPNNKSWSTTSSHWPSQRGTT